MPVTAHTPEDLLGWLVNDSATATDEQFGARVSPELLDALGGPAACAAALGALRPLRVRRILLSRPDLAVAVMETGDGTALRLRLIADAGRVAGLLLDPMLTHGDVPVPRDWAEVDAGLAALGPRVSFAACEIDASGACLPVHGVDPDLARPMGSSSKLYLLGALLRAVAAGELSWDDPLPLRAEDRNGLSGELHRRPAGTVLTLAQHAEHLIAASDNTAADHLLRLLGRAAVERELVAMGNRVSERTIPFPSTKALCALKNGGHPDPAGYPALSAADKRAVLVELERGPSRDAAWPAPAFIDEIEWFAAPSDICRALAALHRRAEPVADHVLSLNDGGLQLDPDRFPTVWYKGGSEPGVLTLNHLARTAGGRAVATSLMVSDPAAPLAEAGVVVRATPLLRGAFQLLAARR